MSKVALVAAILLAASNARAVEGFTIGLEGATGTWNADPALIAAGSAGAVDVFTASAFTGPLHEQSRLGFNFHLGWNIKGHAAVEAVLQSAMWDVLTAGRGGAGMTGLRVTWFPAQAFLPPQYLDRIWDLGLEIGGGYTIAGGPTFGMAGSYLALGVMAEISPVKWFSFGLGYRHFTDYWSTFYFDFNNGVTAPVSDFSGKWGTFTLAMNFHLSAPQ